MNIVNHNKVYYNKFTSMSKTFFSNLKLVFTDVKFYLAGFLVLFSTYVNFYMSELIHRLYPYRQPASDLLFDVLPYIGWTQYVTDIAVLISAVLIMIYISKHDARHFSFYLMLFAVVYFIRALIIPLTPLGGAFGNMTTYGLTTIQQHGMFPSGHTALAAVAYFAVDRVKAPGVKHLLFWMLIIQVASLLLSRGHYSIDIIGGILISYLVVTELTKHKAAFCCKGLL